MGSLHVRQSTDDVLQALSSKLGVCRRLDETIRIQRVELLLDALKGLFDGGLFAQHGALLLVLLSQLYL